VAEGEEIVGVHGRMILKPDEDWLSYLTRNAQIVFNLGSIKSEQKRERSADERAKRIGKILWLGALTWSVLTAEI